MKQLTNGTVQIVTGTDEEDLKTKYQEFLDELEADSEEWSIVNIQPAMLILVCPGDPEFLDIPNLVDPDAPNNEEWAARSAQEIVSALDREDAAKV